MEAGSLASETLDYLEYREKTIDETCLSFFIFLVWDHLDVINARFVTKESLDIHEWACIRVPILFWVPKADDFHLWHGDVIADNTIFIFTFKQK